MSRPRSAGSVLRQGLSLAALAASLFAAPAAAHDRPSGFDALKPGEFVTHELQIPVRIVLIGFDEDAVDPATILALLPPSYKPLVRFPQFYGLSGRDLGLDYQFQYRVARKGRHFTNRFFGHLAAIGEERPRTLYQTLYNAQATKVPDVAVPPTVLFIDGPSVQRWLEENDPADDERYTIYFINWYGRDDFRFHVYTKTDEPDPDNGFNFGALLSSRKMISWGGSSGRSWFYDFSAGPEVWGGNFNVDNADLDGDGVSDYRIPVIWEYSFLGFRPPFFLSFDMGLLARFVAVNLLFTSSPLYDPLVTAPEPFGRKIAHITMLEDHPDPAQKGIDRIDPAFARSKLRSFQPYYRWRVNLRNQDPIDDGAKRSLDIFTLNNVQDDCWNAFGTPFAQLFCYFDANRASYVPPYRPRDYVAPVFAFNTTDAGIGAFFGLLGFADDNWVDGTQSFVFDFAAPGYGPFQAFTTTTVHELGHHIGLSHPHDGYDSELGLDYGPSGFFYLAWVGDESDTVMHYLSISNGFGRHNRDNMRRWETAGYLNWANALAGDILASPKWRKARAALRTADGFAAKARQALKDWDYLEAATSARSAYSVLAEAAKELGVSSARLDAARAALPNARVPKTGCRPRPTPEEQQAAE